MGLALVTLAWTLATVSAGCAKGTVVLADCDPECDEGSTCVDGTCVAEDPCPSGQCDGPECGNGLLEQGEECDRKELGGATCVTKGFQGGELRCTNQCVFNVTECSNTTMDTCGDGVCGGTESTASCCVDCGCGGAAMSCEGAAPGACIPGDWLCAPGNYNAGDGCQCACGAWDPDCNDAGAVVTNCDFGQTCTFPGECTVDGWQCDPGSYGTGDGCHCQCGVWDPDCGSSAQPVFNCGSGQTCSLDGLCTDEVAPGWTCDPGYYGTFDGCDCLCGAWDPDCDDPDQSVLNCDVDQICVQPGICENLVVRPGWICDPLYYGAADGCDCECGAWDPDCDDPGQDVLNCEVGQICVQPGVCEGEVGIPGWACDPMYYAAADGCDCACGIWDPDCDDPGQDVLNCDVGQICVQPGVCSP